MRSIYPLILLAAGALGAESPSEQYEGFTGYWLKHDRAAAFAALRERSGARSPNSVSG